MKKRLAALAAALVLCSAAASGEGFAKNGMLAAPGSYNATFGLGYEWRSFGAGAGIEYPIGKISIGAAPLSLCAAARAGVQLSPLGLTAGMLGTLHLCLAALGLPAGLAWLGNLDCYAGIGPGFSTHAAFFLDWIQGESYFLSKNLAANLEIGGQGCYIGALFKYQ